MSAQPTPLLHWPGWSHLGYALAASIVPTALFVVVYGGADWLARLHEFRIAWHLDVDRAVPLVPAAALLYLSLNPLLWMSPLVLRNRRELRALAAALSIAMVVAGVFFIALPAGEIFAEPSPTELAAWAGPYRLARLVALRYNYFPSLHVAFTVVCVAAYSRYGTRVAKFGVTIWGIAIVASTLLTHQHYLLDVAGGLLLGWIVLRYVYLPWCDSALPAQPAPAALASPGRDSTEQA